MRSFRLFRKSKNVMPQNAEKLTREDKKRITQNVENRLGLNDARPRLGGGPVMAALTAMAMLTLMVAGGIYIAGKDDMVIDPAVDPKGSEIVTSQLEFASDYVYCDMYIGEDDPSVTILLPYAYENSSSLPTMSIEGVSGTNGVKAYLISNGGWGSASVGGYSMGELQVRLDLPWESGAEITVEGLLVDVDDISAANETIIVRFPKPLRFHCVDTTDDEAIDISMTNELYNGGIKSLTEVTSTEYRELQSITMLTGEPLDCYEQSDLSTPKNDLTADYGQRLRFGNVISQRGDFVLQKSAQLSYIYTNALLTFRDGYGNEYNVIAAQQNGSPVAIPDSEAMLIDIIGSSTSDEYSTNYTMNTLAGNFYSQEVIEDIQATMSEERIGKTTLSNDIYSVDVQSVLCDGVTANILMVITPLNDEANAAIQDNGFSAQAEIYSYGGSAIKADLHKRMSSSILYNDLYARVLSFSVSLEELGSINAASLKIKLPGSDEITLSMSLGSNVDMSEFVSEDGKSIYLSRYAFYAPADDPYAAAENGESFTLYQYTGVQDKRSAANFGLEVYKPSIIEKIEYNGETYTKKGV